ncbi:nucleoside-diphosphate-sugar epimerase [Chryseobacterium sp. MP_3.2]|nr:nucleoside-diphosphate-sugar epimerase [Chryseobacterium sp. MP_3.2]
MTNKTVIVAGGTGNLGGRIIKELLKKDVEVWVHIRSSKIGRKPRMCSTNTQKKSCSTLKKCELKFRLSFSG